MFDQDGGADEHGRAHDRDQPERRDDPGGAVKPWRAHVVGDPKRERVKRQRGTASHSDRQRDEHGDRGDGYNDEQPYGWAAHRHSFVDELVARS